MSGCLSRPLFLGALAAVALSLQGCGAKDWHDVGFWRQKSNYIVANEFKSPFNNDLILNSCADEAVPVNLKCSGRGNCRTWRPVSTMFTKTPRLSFCECDTNYAGPECTMTRKSHLTAYLLSIFLGVFGVDQFYLGYYSYGVGKLLTLGGAGLWYVYDLVRIGSSPVYAKGNYRCADDLPHWAWLLTIVSFMLFIGFSIAIYCIYRKRLERTREMMILKLDDGSIVTEPLINAGPMMGGGYIGYAARFGEDAGSDQGKGPQNSGGYGTTQSGGTTRIIL